MTVSEVSRPIEERELSVAIVNMQHILTTCNPSHFHNMGPVTTK